MPLAIPAIPEISISLASPEEPMCEPFSPFSPAFSPSPKTQTICVPRDDDGFRATLLSPPPNLSPRALSPLRPADIPAKGKGLERERFEALLRASRERNAAVGSRKEVDLRKEIALKAHKTKQVERRALFLSKVQAPPSPTATVTPATPPESPAIFHYSLPSPGMESPIAMFDNMSPSELTGEPWVEQVDFRMPGKPIRSASLSMAPAPSKRKVLPSLDQITARLNSHVMGAGKDTSRGGPRLPSFLQSSRRSPLQTAPPVMKEAEDPLATPKTRMGFPQDVGRLRFPARSPAPESKRAPLVIRSPKPCLPPDSPTLCAPPKLQVTTTVVPRTNTTSPTKLSESNLLAWNASADSRVDTRRKMLMRLQRRTLSSSEACVPTSPREDEEERKLRRRSAPPELQETHKARSGFEHPILALPGAF